MPNGEGSSVKRFTIRVDQVRGMVWQIMTCTCGAYSGQLSPEQMEARVAKHRNWHGQRGEAVTRTGYS